MSSTGVRIRRFVREHQVFSGLVGAVVARRDPLPTVAVLPPGAEVLATARTWRDGDQARCP